MITDGLPTPRRYWAILTIMLGTALAVLDSSIANVALPTIAADLKVTPAGSIWIVNAFQIAVVVSLLPFAALGEILGYRRVYQAGAVVFTVSSLACALADSLPLLTAARALQGFGAAAIMAVTTALLRHTYPQRMLGRGLGLHAASVSASIALGPAICAAVLAVAGWPWIFAVNVPLGVVVVAVAARALPASEPSPRCFDWVSTLLNAMTFGPLIVGVDTLTRGDGSWIASAEIALGLSAGAVLVRRSLGQANPMAPVDLLGIRILRLSLMTSVCAFGAQMAVSLVFPFVLQYGYGRSAGETGLLMTPWPLATVVAAVLVGGLADRISAGLLGGIGLGLLALGLLALAVLPPDPAAWDVAWRMAVCGTGFGLFQTPNNRAIISSAPRHRSGAAGGVLATARLLGFIVGALLAALLFRLRPMDHTPFVPLLAAAGLAVTAALISLTRIGKEQEAA